MLAPTHRRHLPPMPRPPLAMGGKPLPPIDAPARPLPYDAKQIADRGNAHAPVTREMWAPAPAVQARAGTATQRRTRKRHGRAGARLERLNCAEQLGHILADRQPVLCRQLGDRASHAHFRRIQAEEPAGAAHPIRLAWGEISKYPGLAQRIFTEAPNAPLHQG